MNGRVGVTVVVVAVLLTGTGPIAAAAGSTDTGQARSSPFALQQDGIDADEVQMDVALQPNGTAEWTLEFWVQLDDNESTTAFESLRDDIRDDPESHTQTFAERMNDTVTTASDATGREMSADGFAVETERQSFAREYGVVRYTFRWHGFAAVEGDELRAGDAIEGIYLDEGTRLLVEWPEGYERTSVTPDPDDAREHAVIWYGGETDFVSGEPRVVVTAGGSGLSTTTIAGVVVATIGLGAVGAWWYRNRTSAVGPTTDGDGESDRASDPGSSSAASAETTDESAGSSATGRPDMDLLSNEEQVLRLVRDNGGRMKQQAVVEELGWTDAKTSKVVSGLREEGELESFRLGRENVLSLPDADDPMADPNSDSAE
ncbi:helix-turn-helix transcriptional regulator [Haloarchaeobius amylolyticus]|uniref:Helix-turn-helix transcriptional regulator n=1 Tax=Haloarchaeobius amylolyticus TaxID=1198296 RepID=A0ABD6BK29_9EURY